MDRYQERSWNHRLRYHLRGIENCDTVEGNVFVRMEVGCEEGGKVKEGEI
jgi:hypothetical protein